MATQNQASDHRRRRPCAGNRAFLGFPGTVGGKIPAQLLYTPNDSSRQYWSIEGHIRGLRSETLTEQQLRVESQRRGRNIATPQAARDMDDISLRLKHMDGVGSGMSRSSITPCGSSRWQKSPTWRPPCAGAGTGGWPRCGKAARAVCVGHASFPPR